MPPIVYSADAPPARGARSFDQGNARVGQATPPASATTMPPPEAGGHNPATIAAPEAAASGNGRRPHDRADAEAASTERPRASTPLAITLEAALYGLILIAAVLTRFWETRIGV